MIKSSRYTRLLRASISPGAMISAFPQILVGWPAQFKAKVIAPGLPNG